MPPAVSLMSLEFSPDGSMLASSTTDGGFGGSVRLWSTVRGVAIRLLDGPLAGGGAGFSADGKTIGAVTFQEGFRRWSVATGKLLPAIHLAKDDPAFEPSQPRLDEAIRRSPFRAEASAATMSRDEAEVAFVTERTHVHLLDRKTGKETATFESKFAPTSLRFSSDGKALATVAMYDGFQIWDLATLRATATIAGRHGEVAFFPDGTSFAYLDDELFVGDVATGQVRIASRPYIESGAADSFALSASGAMFAFGGGDHGLRLVRVDRTPSIRVLGDTSQAVLSAAFSADDSELVSVTDGSARVWKTADGSALRAFGVPYSSRATFSPDGKSIVVGGYNVLEFADLGTGRFGASFPAPKDLWLGSLLFTPKGDALIAATQSGAIASWDAATKAPRATVKGQVIAIDAQGAFVAAGLGPDIVIERLPGFVETARFAGAPDEKVRSIALSHDGALVAAGGERGVRIVNAHTRQPKGGFETEGEVVGIGFTAGDAAIVYRDARTHVRRVDGTPLVDIAPLQGHDAACVLTRVPMPLVEIIGPDTAAAESALVCRVGDLSYPFDLCRERYEVDDLLARAMKGESPPAL